MNQLIMSVKHQLSDLNLDGNILKVHASWEVFLGRVEKELFSNEINNSLQSNLSGEEW